MANPWTTLGIQDAICQADLAKALNDSNWIHWETDNDPNHQKPFWVWFDAYYSLPGTPSPPPNKPVKTVTDVFPEWRFNHKFTPRERNCLLCVYAKMKKEGLWKYVDGLNGASQRAELDFWPKGGSELFRQTLLQGNKFHHYCFSNWGGYVWGLRSVKGGTELHFRGMHRGLVNAHIDIANPASCWSDGIAHRKIDDGEATRNRNHTPDILRVLLSRQLIRVPAVP